MRFLWVIAFLALSFQICCCKPTRSNELEFRKISEISENSTVYFEKQFKEAIECVIKDLRQGDPAAGIPSFDPWRATKVVPVIVDKEYLILNVQLANLVVGGLLDSKVVSVKLTPTFELEVIIVTNEVHLTASYSGNANLLGLFNVYGEGALDIFVKNLTAKRTLQLRMTPPLVETYISTAYVADGSIKLTGLFGDEDLSKELSDLASVVFAPALNNHLQILTKESAPFVRELINSQIGHLSFLDLLAYVSSMNCEDKKDFEKIAQFL